MPTPDQPQPVPSATIANRPGLDIIKTLLVPIGLVLLGTVLVPLAVSPSLWPAALEIALAGLSATTTACSVIIACCGWGLLALKTLRRSDEPASLSLATAVGLALVIWLILAVGSLGVLSVSVLRVLCYAITFVGGIYAAYSIGRSVHERRASLWWLPLQTRDEAAPQQHSITNALLVVCCILAGGWLAFARSIPGLLWPSEFGGYDSLSYHLPLAQEWAASGRIWPSEHNVYSYLPSGLEALFAFRSLAYDKGGMLAADGMGLRGAQSLHACIGIVAAFGAGSAARALAGLLSVNASTSRLAGASATLLVLLSPWAIVVGTLSYNEMGLVLMLVASLSVLASFAKHSASHHEGSFSNTPTLVSTSDAIKLGVLLAVLVGGACSIKPTALLMLGAPVALAMVLLLRPKSLFIAVGAGVCVGCFMLAPWLVRNAMASGNPVFPFASSIFAQADGTMAHWSAEQNARHAAAHRFDGTITDRLKLLLVPDANDPAGVVHRGLRHPQWGEFVLASLAVAAVAAWHAVARMRSANARVSVSTNRLILALSLSIPLQLVLWLMTTHIQSRFLLPVLGSASVLLALLIAGAISLRPQRSLDASRQLQRAIALLGCVLILTWWRAPAAMNIPGIPIAQGIITPIAAILPKVELPLADPRVPPARPEAVVAALPPSSRVVLIGDATPLYFPQDAIAWSTTWDTSPYVKAGSLRALREAGFTHALINFAELSRLARSKFLDPRINPEAIIKEVQAGPPPIALWAKGAVVLVPLQ